MLFLNYNYRLSLVPVVLNSTLPGVYESSNIGYGL